MIERFKEYYKKQNVIDTYDTQREGTKYRRNKRKKELQIFLELIDKKEGEKVLELGCSSGFLAKHLGEVTAIDTSPDMLKIAKQKNPKANVVLADMFKLPFGKNSFDKVVTMRVWNHLQRDDLIRAMREAKRVLKDRGFLIFDSEEVSTLRAIVNYFYKIVMRTTGYKIYRCSIEDISEIAKEEEFEIKELKFLKHRIGRQLIFKMKKEVKK